MDNNETLNNNEAPNTDNEVPNTDNKTPIEGRYVPIVTDNEAPSTGSETPATNSEALSDADVASEESEETKESRSASELYAEEPSGEYSESEDGDLSLDQYDELYDEFSELEPEKPRRMMSVKTAMVLFGFALILGVLFGRFVLASIATSNQLNGVTTLTESELTTTVASYTYNGLRYEVSAQEVIEFNMSLESAVNSDGTYTMPTADEVLSYVRTQILNAAIEAEGIEVSDDELDEFAESYLGSSDYASIASSWGLDEDSAIEILRQSCGQYKLREQMVGSVTAELPDVPDTCDSGNEDVATAEYGAYIVSLLGDEWDTETDTWARTDGDYYAALSGYEFSSTSGTYNQAIAAYYVAYTLYYEESSAISEAWTAYVNTLLSTVEMTIYSLVA